ncbi:MAG: HAD-IIB family hydrolase [Bdellovibrionales bacterium]
MTKSATSSAMDLARKDKEKHIVFADFDNTQLMTKDQKAVRDYNNLSSMLTLRHLAEEGVINLVHCTGRVFDQIHRDIQSGTFSDIGFPVASKTKTIISGVGTEIYQLNEEGTYIPDTGWESVLEETGFHEEASKFSVQGTGRVLKEFCEYIEEILGTNIDLRSQEDDKQTRFKKSLWGKPAEGVTEEKIKEAVATALKGIGADPEKVEITASVQTSKIAIDLTPKGPNFKANKEYACMYLMKKTGVNPENTYMTGDSGNDSHCINVPDVKIILPANAQATFVKSVQEAHNENRVFQSATGNAASGLIEGLVQSGVIAPKEEQAARRTATITLSDFQHDLFVKDEGGKPFVQTEKPFNHS